MHVTHLCICVKLLSTSKTQKTSWNGKLKAFPAAPLNNWEDVIFFCSFWKSSHRTSVEEIQNKSDMKKKHLSQPLALEPAVRWLPCAESPSNTDRFKPPTRQRAEQTTWSHRYVWGFKWSLPLLWLLTTYIWCKQRDIELISSLKLHFIERALILLQTVISKIGKLWWNSEKRR